MAEEKDDSPVEVELCLKSLPASATEDSIRAHYEPGASSLKKVRLKLDPSTGECKGMGWLTLGDAREAEVLVDEWNEEPFNKIDGRRVIIARAVELSNCSWQQRDEKARAVGGDGYPCKFGLGCSRRDCTFQHPDGWDPSKITRTSDRLERPCRFGVKCGRIDCFFQHPDGWDPAKVLTARPMRDCRLGRSCTFRGCFYAHPDGRDCDEMDSAPTLEESAVNGNKVTKEKKKRKQADETIAAAVEIETVPPADIKKKKKRKSHSDELPADAGAKTLSRVEAAASSKQALATEDGQTPPRKLKRKKDVNSAEKAAATPKELEVAKEVAPEGGKKKKRKSREAV